ncbi:MAG: enoyl-CoA hydratase-related protein [Chloroflexi bacterium]|nr:enoyl-CoA hydratase-related protein [Chloroflexota bacterium]
MPEDILVARKDGVATITFNRPDQRNAINYEGWLELKRIVTVLDDEPDLKVVVLTGAGEQAFSAGADIKDFDRHRKNSSEARTYAAAFDGAMDALEALSKPTICLIKGFCIGGGCELSMAADLRIAADNSKFGIPVAKLGILVGYREMRRLVNLVGPGNASYVLMSGRILGPGEALRMGLVNEVVPLADIDEYVYELACEMAPLAPLSQARHKRILQSVLANPSLERLTAGEEELPFTNFDSEDFQEGRRAFIERRTPRFKGR